MSFDRETADKNAGALLVRIGRLETLLRAMACAAREDNEKHYNPERIEFSYLIDIARDQLDDIYIDTEQLETYLRWEGMELDVNGNKINSAEKEGQEQQPHTASTDDFIVLPAGVISG